MPRLSTTTLALAAAATLATTTSAYPFMATKGAAEHYLRQLGEQQEQSSIAKRQEIFNAQDQLVDVTGAHAFTPPGSGDLRGPCPGLNALANHNYLPHNGVTTLTDAIQATNQVFAMGIDLAGFLSTYATLIDGDPLTATWSIGGAPSSSGGLVGGLLGGVTSDLLHTPQGLSGSHNKYESDASPGRGDAALYNGDASTLQLSNFQQLYGLQPGDSGGNYDLGILTQFAQTRIDESRAQNPDFFWGPFTGVVVSQAAFSFIPAFMSNHSAANPQGVLDQDVLKSFFAVSGTQNNLSYKRGYEQIPANWYRRSSLDPYTIPAFIIDQQKILLAVPERVAVGGNLGHAGQFAGVDVAHLTNGVYNAQNLLQGNNAFCFGVESLLTVLPDVLKGLLSDLSAAEGLISKYITPGINQLSCPQLSYYNKDVFSQFPGATGAVL